MIQIEYFALFAGTILFIGKWYISHLLTGAKEPDKRTEREAYIVWKNRNGQWPAKRLVWIPIIGWLTVWLLMTPDEREGGIRDWLYDTPTRQVLVDTFFGYIGMHILSSFGESIFAGVAIIAYTVACAIMIFLVNTKKKFFKPKRRMSYELSR